MANVEAVPLLPQNTSLDLTPSQSLTTPSIGLTTEVLNQTGVRILNFLVGVVMGVTIEENADGFVKDRFYCGSRLLQPITNWSGIPVDMINFVVASFVSIPLALFMRYALPPSRVPPVFRALTEAILGTGVVLFCFGMQLRVLLVQSLVAYIMLWLCRRDRIITPVAVTIWSLLYLMLIHQCRLYYDYEGYTLDISGAVMLQTQRLSSLAFNLYDGARIAKANSAANGVCKTGTDEDEEEEAVGGKDEATRAIVRPDPDAEPKLAASSRAVAVAKMPNPLEFVAYCLYFHGVCIGPFVFFKDYHRYLHGYEENKLPSVPLRRLFYLTLRLAAYGLLYAALFTRIPVNFIKHPTFHELNLASQTSYMIAAFFVARLKYYFGWSLAEILGICAGNGYTGVDPSTQTTLWLNVHNFDFFQVETAPNLKLLIDAWNIGTVRWLREVVYLRAPARFNTICVFLVSAFWHGLYPGYYLMFLSFALFTYTSRIWRRNVRSHVVAVGSATLQVAYDVFTMVLTHAVMEYAQAPFHLLSFMPSVVLWLRFYFIPHIIGFLAIVLTPPVVRCLKKAVEKRQRRKEAGQSVATTNGGLRRGADVVISPSGSVHECSD